MGRKKRKFVGACGTKRAGGGAGRMGCRQNEVWAGQKKTGGSLGRTRRGRRRCGTRCGRPKRAGLGVARRGVGRRRCRLKEVWAGQKR